MSKKLIYDNNSMRIYTYGNVYLLDGAIHGRFHKLNLGTTTVDKIKYHTLTEEDTSNIIEILKEMSPYQKIKEHIRSLKGNEFIGTVINNDAEFHILSTGEDYIIFGEPMEMIKRYRDRLDGFEDFENHFIDDKYMVDLVACVKNEENLAILNEFLDVLMHGTPDENNAELKVTSEGVFVNGKKSSKTMVNSVMDLIENGKTVIGFTITLNGKEIFPSKTKNPKLEEIIGSLTLAENVYKRSGEGRHVLIVKMNLANVGSLSPIRDKSRSRSKKERLDEMIEYAMKAQQSVENLADKAREIKMLGENPLRVASSLGGRGYHTDDKEAVKRLFLNPVRATRTSVERETSNDRDSRDVSGRKFIRNTGADSQIYQRGTDNEFPHQSGVVFNKRKGNQGYLMPVEVYAQGRITEECSFGKSGELCGMKSPGFTAVKQACGLCHCHGHNRSVCVCPFCKLINSHAPAACPLIDARFFVSPDYKIKCTCSVGGICPQCIRGRGIDDVFFLVSVKTNETIDISILAKGPIDLIDELRTAVPDNRKTVIVQNLYYLLTHDTVRLNTADELDGAMTSRLRHQLETLITSEEGFEKISRSFISGANHDSLSYAPERTRPERKDRVGGGIKLF